MNVYDMHALGERILRAAKKLTRGRVGVTILVHDAVLEDAPCALAISTTLPNRAQTRIIYASALYGACQADGATPGNVIGDGQPRRRFAQRRPQGVVLATGRPCTLCMRRSTHG